MDFFEYKNNELHAENVPLSEIAQEVGTPVYVYSKAAFVGRLEALSAAFKNQPHLICYSVKVAGNLSLLKLAAEGGFGADIVSGGELFRVQKAGIPTSKTVFSGVGKTGQEIAEALKAGILMFNVESEEELAKIGQVAAEMNKKASVSLRVNPAVDPQTHPYIATGLKESKFGIAHDRAVAVYAQAAGHPNLMVVGLDCHIGSQLTKLEPFIEAVQRLKGLVLDLRAAGHEIKYLDVGGGLGIKYNDEQPPTPDEYARSLIDVIGDLGVTLILEPGRVVAGSSAVLLVETLYNKRNGDKNFVVINGAMTDLIRPSLYGAYHEITPVKKREGELLTVDVVGPVCESSDFLAKDRPLPPVSAGDLLAVKSAGAYGFTMSSNYNSRTRAAEVLVDGGEFKVIKTRETYADLIRGEG